jgi:hypothetical protein
MSQTDRRLETADDTPLDNSSDGYATGLITFALAQVEARQASEIWVKR